MKEISNLHDLEKAIGFKNLNKFFTEYSMLALGKMMEDVTVSVNDLATDKYGNNTSFPNSVLSDMTTKGLLGKWTYMISSKVRHALYKYYMKTQNIDVGYKSFTVPWFIVGGNKAVRHYQSWTAEEATKK